MRISIASWNIAGATRILNGDTKNGKEDVPYFSRRLEEIKADFVCIQETQTNSVRSFTQEIAEKARYEYYFETMASPSHNNPDYQLGIAILSKQNFDKKQFLTLPNPNLSRTTASGKVIFSHDKVVQIVRIGNVWIGNTQFLPIHIFGHNYNEGLGLDILTQIEKELVSKVSPPVIFCGDFNYDFSGGKDMMLSQLKLKDTLPQDEMTFIYMDSINKHPDHIFISDEFRVSQSEIIQTESDHFLCYAELEI